MILRSILIGQRIQEQSRLGEKDKCWRLNPEWIISRLTQQKSIATHEPILGQCCMRPNLFHLTIGMLRLEGPEGLVAARAMMERLRPVVEEMFRDKDSATLEINGLSNFGQRVVYANVLPKSDF